MKGLDFVTICYNIRYFMEGLRKTTEHLKFEVGASLIQTTCVITWASIIGEEGLYYRGEASARNSNYGCFRILERS
jgi:hypothetical protein